MSDLLEAHDPDTLRALLPDQPLPPADRLRPVPARRADARPADASARLLRALRAADRRRASTTSTPRPAAAEFDAGEPRRCSRRSPSTASRFLDAMDDDFNTGGAIGELFELVHALNRFADAKLDRRAATAALAEYRRGHGRPQGADADPRPLPPAPRAGPSRRRTGSTAPLLDLLVELRTQASQGEELQAGRRDPQPARGARRRPRRPARRHGLADRVRRRMGRPATARPDRRRREVQGTEGPSMATTARDRDPPASPTPSPGRVVGIDPGLHVTGLRGRRARRRGARTSSRPG